MISISEVNRVLKVRGSRSSLHAVVYRNIEVISVRFWDFKGEVRFSLPVLAELVDSNNLLSETALCQILDIVPVPLSHSFCPYTLLVVNLGMRIYSRPKLGETLDITVVCNDVRDFDKNTFLSEIRNKGQLVVSSTLNTTYLKDRPWVLEKL